MKQSANWMETKVHKKGVSGRDEMLATGVIEYREC